MTDTAAWLGRHPGVTDAIHVPDLPLAEIDMVASITNQSRFEPIDQPTVDRYIAALEDGATFPSIIVRQIKQQRTTQLVILGGNHRARAHLDAGRTTIDSWLITCDDLTALEISYGDNATHGLAPTHAERLAHALVLVDRGRSAADAARTVGIDPQAVHRRLAAQGVEKRAARAGVIAELAQLPQTIHPRLASLRGDQLFARVVRTFATERITSVEGIRIIADLNEQPTTKAAVELLEVNVDEHRRRDGATVGRTVGRPSENPRLRLLTALGTIRALTPDQVADACAPEDVNLLHDACTAAVKQLIAIDKAAARRRLEATA